jgi:hypothetical protein
MTASAKLLTVIVFTVIVLRIFRFIDFSRDILGKIHLYQEVGIRAAGFERILKKSGPLFRQLESPPLRKSRKDGAPSVGMMLTKPSGLTVFYSYHQLRPHNAS